ncbi:DUF262 domain-containing protein [Parasutterella excrementihominis]|uniref:DUF262 domain-containing protein n=4 Tax=Parasutterella excrementihominis TaxID=487175 RepID=UPI00242F4196|nr:DUF262 domain-containing protein [Parasutterella excrementihominis]
MTKESFFANQTLPLKELFAENLDLKDYKVFPSQFQRGYCWSNSTAVNFIQAIADSETLNAGTIVLAHDPQNKTIEIVDGQQRLYTLLLFYKAIALKSGEKCPDSFFSKLQMEGENEEQKLDLPSKIQLSKNFHAIREKFSSDENLDSVILQRLKELEVTIFFLENDSSISNKTPPALAYYIQSNTSGVELTPGQLLKAFHYSKMTPNKDKDIRYLIEAWRLGYLSKFYTSFEPITFNNQKLEDFISSLKLSYGLENEENKPRENINFISSPLGVHSFSVESFIGNNDWNLAFYEFEGFLNTFQLMLYGGRFPKETALGVPVFHDMQFYPGGIERLQTSVGDKLEDDKADDRDLISRLLHIRSGLSFFQTTQDLLVEYSKLADALKATLSCQKDSITREAWISTVMEAIETFRKEWTEFSGGKKKVNIENFNNTIKNSGILLSLSCIALLFHLVFESRENQSSSKKEGNTKIYELLKDIVFSALWGGFSNGAYDTECRGTGVFEAGPIFLLSPTPSVARDRMIQAIQYNNAKLLTNLQKAREDNQLYKLESLRALR